MAATVSVSSPACTAAANEEASGEELWAGSGPTGWQMADHAACRAWTT